MAARNGRGGGPYRCGYCLMAEHIVGMPMELDHLIPESLGGVTEAQNLWLACPGCNARKADRVLGIDPATGDSERLFDPRRQAWQEHFRWIAGGTLMECPDVRNSGMSDRTAPTATGSKYAVGHVSAR